MKAILVALALTISAPAAALAQEVTRDGYFDDHTAMRTFIDERMAELDIGAIYARLAPSPVAAGEVNRVQTSFSQAFEAPFLNSGYLWSTASPDGFREDILVYWNADDEYVYMLLVTHQRADDLIILRWQMETTYSADHGRAVARWM